MLFSLGIPDENPDQETPNFKWNYALNTSAKEIRVEHFKMPGKWEWTLGNAPVCLLVKTREFDWHPTENEPLPGNLWVNGVKIEKQEPQYIDFYERKENLGKEQAVYAFILPASCLKQGENEISFQSLNEDFKVKRLEVLLKYGDVKTNGYF